MALEYALLVSVVVGALLAMQVYLKRSNEGRLRQAADQIGTQYAPGRTHGDSTTWYTGTTVNDVVTMTEADLAQVTGQPQDINHNGVFNETTVWVTETTSSLGVPRTDASGNVTGYIDPPTTTIVGNETVGPFENSL